MQGIPVGGKDKTFLLPSSGAKFDVNDWGFTKFSPITLIKFGVFLSMLQKICNVTNGESNQLLQFEMVNDISDGPEEQLKRDDTFIATYPGNFSSNPNKCLIKHFLYDRNLIEFDDEFTTDTLINNSLSLTSREGEGNTMQKLENPSLAMRLSDVYINIGFIAEVMSNLRGTDTESDDEVTITVIDLLRGVLSGVNTCLGGINNFRILYSEATCEIQIVSETPILSQKATDDTPTRATINTFGFNTTDAKLAGGSFITSMDLNSELTDQMATQISIGAQNGGSTINSNSTAFSTYSKGLIDTLFEEKIDSLTEEEKKKKEEEDLKNAMNNPVRSVADKIQTILEESKFLTAFDQVYDDREFNPESYISTLENVVSNLSPLFQALYTMKKNSPAPFFLPFNLSLEMHGLAGMKIFNSFSIDGKGLPLSYNPKNIKLVIKSLSHTLSLEGWKTKVETISTPIFDVTSTTAVFNRTVSDGSGEFGYDDPVLAEDPYPTINPSGIGSNGYSNSQLAITMKASGFKNATIPLDKLVFIGETKNARSTYTNPATGKPEYMLHPNAANAWFRWRKEMNANGIKYRISSAYRDFAHQKSLGSKNTIAGAGSSPHGWGGALDFGNLYQIVGGSGDAGVNLQGRKTEAYKQIAEIGAKHGFYNPKRLAKTWGTNEIWHFEYWGAVDQITI